MQLRELIELALVHTGTQKQLAALLGVPPSYITDWKNGHRTCSPTFHALIAAAAGLDPAEALLRAELERTKGTPTGKRLHRALGKRRRLRLRGKVEHITEA